MAPYPTPPRRLSAPSSDDSVDLLKRRRSIEFSEKSTFFLYNEDEWPTTGESSSSLARRMPRKSILKTAKAVPPSSPVRERQVTPLPENALANSEYLAWPISVILAQDSTLRDIVAAYNRLVERLRLAIPIQAWVSHSEQNYALLAPLRTNSASLTVALVRDLGRVFTDPFSLASCSNTPPSRDTLPSPRHTPSPKKGGMDEAQVKYSRDLTATSISALKFLTLAFSLPAIFKVFTAEQIDSVMDAAMTILVEDSLQSANSRKVYGFAVAFLQSLRLPPRNLEPASAKIVRAIQRGLEGELGREGKKGSIAESLKSVHELSSEYPKIFLPILLHILPSILKHLTGPNLIGRIQAANAIGGLALGLSSADHDLTKVHREYSAQIVSFLVDAKPKSAPGQQHTIAALLKQTFINVEPKHRALSPYWAMSVLASFIVLLGPAMLTERKLWIVLRPIIEVARKSQKKIFKVFAQILWNPMVWVWHHFRGLGELVDSSDPTQKTAKVIFRDVLSSASHLPVGISLMTALMGPSPSASSAQDKIQLVTNEIQNIGIRFGGDACSRALEVLERLVSAADLPPNYSVKWESRFRSCLISSDLFTVNPGLLTVTDAELPKTLEKIANVHPNLDDLRPFSVEERKDTRLWAILLDAWVSGLRQLELTEEETIPEIFSDIWTGLMQMKTEQFKVHGVNAPQLKLFADRINKCFAEILTSPSIDLRFTSTSKKDKDAKNPFCAKAMYLRLKLTRALWSVCNCTLPGSAMVHISAIVLRFLVKSYFMLVPVDDIPESVALAEWTLLTGQVTASARQRDVDVAKMLWDSEVPFYNEKTSFIWRQFARGFTEGNGSWKGAALILGLPFNIEKHWDMSSSDLSEWQSLLAYSLSKAEEENIPAPDALNEIVQYAERRHIPTLLCSFRVADELLGALGKNLGDALSPPTYLLTFVHEIFLDAYPPKPESKTEALWALRSLQTVLGECPSEMVSETLDIFIDSLCVWFKDEQHVLTRQEYSSDVIPLYQTTLMLIADLHPTSSILQNFAPILSSALDSSHNNSRSEAHMAFYDFWKESCAHIMEPPEGWVREITVALSAVDITPKRRKRRSIRDKVQTDAKDNVQLDFRSKLRLDSPELDGHPSPSTSPVHDITAHSNIFQYTPAFDPSVVSTPKKKTKIEAMKPRKSVPKKSPFAFAMPVSLSKRDQLANSPTRKRHHRRHRNLSFELDNASTEQESEKENVSPLQQKSVLGKRISIDHRILSPKRQKVTMPSPDIGSDDTAVIESSDSEADRMDIEASLLGDYDCRLRNLLSTPSRSPAKLTRLSRSPPSDDLPSSSPPSSLPRTRGSSSGSYDRKLRSHLSDIRKRSDLTRLSRMNTDSSSSPVGPRTPQNVLDRTSLRPLMNSDPPSEDLLAMQSPTKAAGLRKIARAGSSYALELLASEAEAKMPIRLPNPRLLPYIELQRMRR